MSGAGRAVPRALERRAAPSLLEGREFLRGPRRFTELRDVVPGISRRTLTSRVRQFEAHDIVIGTA
ncbi:winged helix-turn-helix transcriptional regulator [Streptomyces phaeochromogenes]|uniref:winged helix-turn-helix transcriptional regulator n=1 Tax=Streptomyces phaeochromogenes TaxID=1923 RepID=UPI0027D85F37|nr:winged helix-turn-helix transcriptional regulator [Streptomyces phaeochromogenes]